MRLLYVEDNRINALLFEEAMRLSPGVEVRVAEDGGHAMRTVAEWTPDVLVLDSHLPDITGLQLLQQLRELPALAGTPAFMCSADAQPEDVQQALDAGFRGYWAKPIAISAILADLGRLEA